jgi:hypothetical protein
MRTIEEIIEEDMNDATTATAFEITGVIVAEDADGVNFLAGGEDFEDFGLETLVYENLEEAQQYNDTGGEVPVAFFPLVLKVDIGAAIGTKVTGADVLRDAYDNR